MSNGCARWGLLVVLVLAWIGLGRVVTEVGDLLK